MKQGQCLLSFVYTIESVFELHLTLKITYCFFHIKEGYFAHSLSYPVLCGHYLAICAFLKKPVYI